MIVIAPLWKINLFHRDNYCCQKCGSTVNLTLHHLFAQSKYPHLRTNMNNLITLCESCHQHFHNVYCGRDIDKCTPFNFLKWIGDDYASNGFNKKPKYIVKFDKRYKEGSNRVWKDEN